MTEEQKNDAAARLDKFLNRTPQVDASAYVAHEAKLIGAVTIGPRANVWPGVVMRADI